MSIATTYRISDSSQYSNNNINENLFGAQFVTLHDFEFNENNTNLELLSSIAPTSLRYPGGTPSEEQFTEAYFLTGEWTEEALATENGNRKLAPMEDFFATAASVNAEAQLVIPTKVAFKMEAGDAIANGRFGERTELHSNYFSLVSNYIDEAFSLASTYGVEISRFEIGNEFWLGGKMTAGEYGRLAGRLVEFLTDHYPSVEVFGQIVHSANLYSPLRDRTVYLEPNSDGTYEIHVRPPEGEAIPETWISSVIPGQGNPISQNKAIAAGIAETANAAVNLDGVVDHIYFDGGLSGIDEEKDFALRYVFNEFQNALSRDDLQYFITEWSPRNPGGISDSENSGSANGLSLAHSVVEAFFELSSNGVDGANYWPLTFSDDSTLYRTLVNTKNGNLTFGGVTFGWLSETQEMRPMFDFEVASEIDIHGFAGEDKLVMFVSDRRSADLRDSEPRSVTIDFDEFAFSDHYFITTSSLTSDDGSTDNNQASPIVSHSPGSVVSSDSVSLDLESFSLYKIVVQSVSDSADFVTGGSGNDFFWTGAGDDVILSSGGNNHIDAGRGNDRVMYSGSKDGFSVNSEDGVTTVTSEFKTDTLVGVEELVFEDHSVPLDAPLDTIAETGTLSLNDNAQTVRLQRSYESPVVIAFVATENGAQPVNVRVSDVRGNDLTLQLQEPNYLDGFHVNETVNYLVVEAGTWILPDGTILEAGTLNSSQLSSQGFEAVAFDAEFDSAPVILSQVQTFNGRDFVTPRQRNADSDGFQLTMQEEEAKNSGGHVSETIGWVALEAGSGTAGGVNFLAGSTSGVNHANALVGLGASMAGGANVIAALSSYAGADAAWARGNGSTRTTFDVSVEEETSQDAETNHYMETVDYFAFDEVGILGAYDYEFFV